MIDLQWQGTGYQKGGEKETQRKAKRRKEGRGIGK
jgi:hypothetical protein